MYHFAALEASHCASPREILSCALWIRLALPVPWIASSIINCASERIRASNSSMVGATCAAEAPATPARHGTRSEAGTCAEQSGPRPPRVQPTRRGGRLLRLGSRRRTRQRGRTLQPGARSSRRRPSGRRLGGVRVALALARVPLARAPYRPPALGRVDPLRSPPVGLLRTGHRRHHPVCALPADARAAGRAPGPGRANGRDERARARVWMDHARAGPPEGRAM